MGVTHSCWWFDVQGGVLGVQLEKSDDRGSQELGEMHGVDDIRVHRVLHIL